MRRDELLHVARAAASIVDEPYLIVVGSQAVHGSFPDTDLPPETTASIEADIAVIDPLVPNAAHRIDGPIGEGSTFHQEFGYYADGVDLNEITLPVGWEGRLRTLHTERATGDHEPVTVRFPEVHDLCASKLVRSGEKDVRFVGALLREGLVEFATLAERVGSIEGLRECRAAQAGLPRAQQYSTQRPSTDLPAPPTMPFMPHHLLVESARRWCLKTLDSGRRCRRRPSQGSPYCWQHR